MLTVVTLRRLMAVVGLAGAAGCAATPRAGQTRAEAGAIASGAGDARPAAGREDAEPGGASGDARLQAADAQGSGADRAIALPDARERESDAQAASPDAGGARAVLVYTRSTGFVHESTPVAAQAIAAAARAAGLAPEISEDPARFTPAALARYAAVVLVATAGEPLGSAAGIEALANFVRDGGGLVGIENATNAHVGSALYVSLLGAVFDGHPGGIRKASCFKEGDHPSVAALPSPWDVTDEIYVFTRFRADNQVVLRCGAERVPISWHRTEGRGRIFFTALGHPDELWTRSRLVPDHVLPGLLWAARR